MTYFKKTFIYSLLGIFFLTSCTKNFHELNATHDKPSATTIGPLINGVISTLFLRGQEQASIFNDYYYPIDYTHTY